MTTVSTPMPAPPPPPAAPTKYPITFEMDTPEKLSRWVWLFKGFLLIPHILLFYVLGILAEVALFISWLAILITGKYPRGLFNFILGTARWMARVNGYGSHFTDKYPPFSMGTEAGYPVRFNAEYPEKSSRMKAFFRYFLALPQFIVLGVISVLFGVLWLVHMVLVVITGKPNSGMFKLMTGILRWNMRVQGYVMLFTDRYPPFSFD